MSDIPRNIQLFNHITAVVLVKLYDSFPNPVDLDDATLGIEAAQAAHSDEQETFKLATQTAASTIEFLEEHGFISTGTPQHLGERGYPRSKLTLAGLDLLGRVPAAVDTSIDRRPVVEQLKSALRQNAPGAIGAAVKGAISLGVQALS